MPSILKQRISITLLSIMIIILLFSTIPLSVFADFRAPVTVSTIIDSVDDLQSPGQHKMWYWEDTIYLFWYDSIINYCLTYSYSNDGGLTWSTPTSCGENWDMDAEDTDIYISGDQIYVVSADEDLYIGLGELSTSGITGLNDIYIYEWEGAGRDPRICVDGDGYLWVLAVLDNVTYLYKFSHHIVGNYPGGNPHWEFSIEDGYPIGLETGHPVSVNYVAGYGTVVYFVVPGDNYLAARRYNGLSWEGIVDSTSYMVSGSSTSIIVGSKVFIAFVDDATLDIKSNYYDASTDTFGSEAVIVPYASQGGETCPQLTYDNTNLYCIWNDNSNQHMYYSQYDSDTNSWGTATDWVDETAYGNYEFGSGEYGEAAFIATPYTNGNSPAAAWVTKDLTHMTTLLRASVFGSSPSCYTTALYQVTGETASTALVTDWEAGAFLLAPLAFIFLWIYAMYKLFKRRTPEEIYGGYE